MTLADTIRTIRAVAHDLTEIEATAILNWWENAGEVSDDLDRLALAARLCLEMVEEEASASVPATRGEVPGVPYVVSGKVQAINHLAETVTVYDLGSMSAFVEAKRCGFVVRARCGPGFAFRTGESKVVGFDTRLGTVRLDPMILHMAVNDELILFGS